MAKSLHFLFIEDSANDAELVVRSLERDGYAVHWERVQSAGQLKAALDREKWDLILCDYSMPSFRGTDALAIVRASGLDVPFIFVSGALREDAGVEAMKAGAHDYVLKGNLKRLLPAIERELREAASRCERRKADQLLALRTSALEAAANAVMITGRDGLIQWVNPAFSGLTGYSSSEVIGQEPRLLKSGRHKPEFYKELWTTILAGKVWHGETINRRKDGSFYTEEQTITPVRDSNGEITHFIGIKQDITERKRVEEELRETHEKLRHLLDHSPAVLYKRNIDAQAVAPVVISENIQHLLGFTVKEAVHPQWWFESLHPEDRQRVTETIAQGTKGPGFSIEYRIRRKDGTYRWVQDDNRVVRDASGTPKEAIGVWTDISDRKQTEEVLRRSEAELAEARRLANYGNWSWDIASDRLTWSDELYGIFGVEKDKLRHSYDSFIERVEPTDRELLHQINRGARLEGKPFECVYRIRTPAGEKRMIRELGYAVRDQAGKVVRLVGVAQDITAQKQAEAELVWKTAFLEAQVNSSLDGILVVSGDGKKILQNERMSELWRIPIGVAAEIDDRKQIEFAIDKVKNPEAFVQRVDYLYAHPNEVSRDEVELRDGTILDRYSSPVIGKDGANYGRIWTFRNITERRRLEAQLRQAVKMEAVGQLAGGVAHDFNNVLSAVLMHLGLLRQSPRLTEDTKESLKELEKEAMRAAGLTRQLLVFSRREVANPKPVDLTELVRNLLKMLRRLLGENIDVVFQAASGSVWLAADPGMTEQVVMNLCINARDAMPKGGRLLLATARVEIGAESTRPGSRAGNFVCLSVIDTGCGMDATVLQRIFEPFFTTKEAGKGTGLGLATVYGIVKQHEGWIEVDSEVGKGSSFRVYLPALKEPVERASVADRPDDVPRGSETILLVEDEVSVRRMAALCLRKLGYAVLEAATGIEALQLWVQHQQHVKLLFTDMIMPGSMTGLDLAQRLREENPNLKVIISSGYNAERVAPSSPAHQHITYFAKPYRTAALAKVVRQCLD